MILSGRSRVPAGKMATSFSGRSAVMRKRVRSTGSVTRAKSSLFCRMLLDTVAGRHVGDMQVDARMIGAQLAQDRRQRVGHGGIGGADAHAADPAFAKATHLRFGDVAFTKNSLGGLEKLLAGRRHICLLAHALDQLHADPPLELADLQADGRLRQVELARGAGEAALVDNLLQRSQLIEVEAAHIKEVLIDMI